MQISLKIANTIEGIGNVWFFANILTDSLLEICPSDGRIKYAAITSSTYESNLSPNKLILDPFAVKSTTVTTIYTPVMTNGDPCILILVLIFVPLLRIARSGYIDALEPAEGMLEKAKKHNIYNRLLCEFMSGDVLPIDGDYYDCVVSAGGFGDGHIPIEALYEMIRIVKPEGIIVIVMRQEYLENTEAYKDKLETLMKKIENNGLWKKINRRVVEEYSFSKTGIIFVYKVL
ncbi:hypothetical protein KUTeg_014715 [Tegillarca granosa]|uniref:Methyltransferase type 11 domain-containing protein n=1 Tax=Tegillarca granosa TaxID=220873 RepID=A0ABQ9ER95_TEGGR|nr:hypothetical protein KUTeg_014715 [Tegillarca granosa]